MAFRAGKYEYYPGTTEILSETVKILEEDAFATHVEVPQPMEQEAYVRA